MIILIYNRKVFDDFGGSVDEYIEWLQKKRKRLGEEIKKCLEDEEELVRKYPKCPICKCRYWKKDFKFEHAERTTTLICPKEHRIAVYWNDDSGEDENIFAMLNLYDEGYGE